MCGIAGIIADRTLTPKEHDAAKRLVTLLNHRGPDGNGVFHGEKAALVQTRLKLVGNDYRLPLRSDPDRLTLVYNGEIYNFKELRAELFDFGSFENGTDSEIILAAWKKWGKGMLHHLEGMFAFLIWDEREQTAFAARDPIGIKPFFYSLANDRFTFSSEAGTLIESRLVIFQPNDEAIAEYLTAPFLSGARSSPFGAIHALLPGHFLTVKNGKVQTEAFFEFDQPLRSRVPSAQKINELSLAVKNAVCSQKKADVRVGCFLSGGLDSTLISAIAQKDSPPIPVWTIHYPNNEKNDYSQSMIIKSLDTPFAVKASKQYGMDLHLISVEEAEYETALVRALNTNDLICTWEQEASQILLASAAAKSVKAVMVGDAADETHYGYSFLLNSGISRAPENMLNFFGTVPLNSRFLKEPVLAFDEKYRNYVSIHGLSFKNPASQIQATSKIISDFWLSRLLHNGDQHTMSSSLEARVPFGDRAVLEFAKSVGHNIGFNDRIEKWHLREAAQAFLTPDLAFRKKSSLPKNLNSEKRIQKLFCAAWKHYGTLIDSYVDSNQMEVWCLIDPMNEKETSLRFRVLALIHWMKRFRAYR